MPRVRCRRLPLQRRRIDMEHSENRAKEEQRSKPIKKVAAFMAAMMSLSLAAGCRVGPNYHRPVVQPPTAFRDLSENPQAQAHAASYAEIGRASCRERV